MKQYLNIPLGSNVNVKSHANCKPEPTFLRRFLGLWNNSDRGDSEQVTNPDFMTPDQIVSKQHRETNHIIASISNQIETTSALLTESGTTSIVVTFTNDNPSSIHSRIPININLSKFAKPYNTVVKLQKTIIGSSNPRKEFRESPKPLQLVSGLLARKFAIPQNMIAQYRKQACRPWGTIAESPKLVYSKRFANRSHIIADSSGDYLNTGFPLDYSHQ